MKTYRIPFITLMDKRLDYDRDCIDSGREEWQSPAWKEISGKEINSDTLGSEVFVGDDDGDNKNGYFYIPSEKDEKGGWTIYHVDMKAFRCFVASLPQQFILAGDPDIVCTQLAKGKTTPELIREAGRKGKGASAAGIILFTRNKSRSDSLVDYRKKMRDRQLPLKVSKQWDFFVEMIENGQLTAASLQHVVYLARDMEAAREGDANPEVPSGWTQQAGRAGYLANGVEG